ncbi:MAG: cation:proton antiporter [Actinomycetota bacterium]|nr:cation:proton antiporter [Actinomycetota bacterium]
MGEIDFSGVVVVAAVAFSAPLLLGLAPALRLPAVVLELVAGIAIGPSGFGWVELDQPIDVLALVGLAFLLFLSGLEIDFERFRGRSVAVTGAGFVVSLGIALVAALLLAGAGQVDSPLLVAIILVATSLGVVVPVLKDSNELSSDLGQLVIAAASIADFGAVILLSLFFSRESTGVGAKLVLLGGFALVSAAAVAALLGAERSPLLSRALFRLQDTTAQIRVRGAFLLLVAFVALAERLGLEVILGAFMAGAVLSLVDRDQRMTHPRFRVKLEAAGFGMFIPVFFVASGIQFDAGALFESGSTLARVPIFLVALVVVRGLPALLYRSALGPRRTLVAALLQATSLPFIVAASMIGIELGLLDDATGAALVAAGLLSVLVFPLAALTALRGRAPHARRAREPMPPIGAGRATLETS